MSDETQVTVRDVPEESVFVIEVDGRRAGRVDYRIDGDRMVFTHTEVSEEFSGRGLAGKLAKHALDDAVERGLVIVPRCPFIAAYAKRHEEYEGFLEEA
ncbi:MAG: GNAT family N-acetyltransferase [Actinomycetes bacterium]|jgi:predicted GNAT family acetyltransferase|nr:MAG: GNAT family N-acetyltransferase [Actinomycetota bacterium]